MWGPTRRRKRDRPRVPNVRRIIRRAIKLKYLIGGKVWGPRSRRALAGGLAGSGIATDAAPSPPNLKC